MKKSLRTILFLLCLGVLFNCKESEEAKPAEKSLISSITPSRGVAGTVVTIKGNDFGATTADNIVNFNGVGARIIAASATEIRVEAPKSQTGEITLVTSTKTSKGPEFTYLPNTGTLNFKGREVKYVPQGEMSDENYWIHGQNRGTEEPAVNIYFTDSTPTVSGVYSAEVAIRVIENSTNIYKNKNVSINVTVNKDHLVAKFSDVILSDYWGPMNSKTSGTFTCYF
jgi:hypothetical protein